MKELRCLVFPEQEVVAAIVERRRRLRESLPEGTIQRASFKAEPEVGVTVTLVAARPAGAEETVTIPESETVAALVNWCMNRKIPMPVAAEKYLKVMNDTIMLMITMHFNRAHRPNPNAAPDDERTQDRSSLRSLFGR